MKVAIYGKSVNAYNINPIKKLIGLLESEGVNLMFHEDFYQLIRDKVSFQNPSSLFSSYKPLSREVNLVISIGGDGTLLNTVPLVAGSTIPVIGLNTGRLGFLASIDIETMETAVAHILKGEHSLDSRTMLCAESDHPWFANQNIALNEFTLLKSESASMMTIHAYINGEYLNAYWADGLIVSTPTGSTAYSLSCGGPIVMPDSANFIITPIAPHNLNVRPLIISDKDVITLKVEGRHKHFLASLDSRSSLVEPGTEITIKRAPQPFHLLRLPGQNFSETLRQKLMWGIDRRN